MRNYLLRCGTSGGTETDPDLSHVVFWGPELHDTTADAKSHPPQIKRRRTVLAFGEPRGYLVFFCSTYMRIPRND